MRLLKLGRFILYALALGSLIGIARDWYAGDIDTLHAALALTILGSLWVTAMFGLSRLLRSQNADSDIIV